MPQNVKKKIQNHCTLMLSVLRRRCNRNLKWTVNILYYAGTRTYRRTTAREWCWLSVPPETISTPTMSVWRWRVADSSTDISPHRYS
jgi:hypothetical protein